MSSIKAIIFDLDGTLLDTLEDLADSMNRVLSDLGHPTHPTDSYRYFVGDGIDNLALRSLPDNKRDQQAISTCAEKMRFDYGKNWQVKTRPYPGIAEMLNHLTEKEIQLTILSNKPESLTQTVVAAFLADWNFEIIAGARPNIPRKPDPAGIFRIMETLGRKRDDFLYLGDTSTDMIAAKKAGMYSLGALWGFRTADELRQSGAQALLKNPMDIKKHLGN